MCSGIEVGGRVGSLFGLCVQCAGVRAERGELESFLAYLGLL